MFGLEEYFNDIEQKLGVLQKDVDKIIMSKSSKKEPSLKSFRPLTIFRKNKEEAIQAQENPDITFVQDRINEIFKG